MTEGQPKGKGKGKNKYPAPTPASEPLPLADASLEDQIELACTKTRQMVSALGGRITYCQEVEAAFKGHPLKSKAVLKILEEYISDMGEIVQDLKSFLLDQRDPTKKKLENMKSKLLQAAQTFKDAAEHAKKIKLLMNDGDKKSSKSKKA